MDDLFQIVLIFYDNIVSFVGRILKNDLTSEKPYFPDHFTNSYGIEIIKFFPLIF